MFRKDKAPPELMGAADNVKSQMKSFSHCLCSKRLKKERAAEWLVELGVITADTGGAEALNVFLALVFSKKVSQASAQ